jgi:hypothetical protein
MVTKFTNLFIGIHFKISGQKYKNSPKRIQFLSIKENKVEVNDVPMG